MQEESILQQIRTENFLKSRRRDVLRASLPIAHYLPMLALLRLALRVTGLPAPPHYDRTIVFFRKSSRNFLEEKPTERNPIMRDIYDRMIELNDIGIDQVQSYKDADVIVKTCLALKKEAVTDRDLGKAAQFLKSSDELFAQREESIGIMKMKNEKQEEIRELINQLNVITRKDIMQVAGAVVLDSATKTGYATAAKLGAITGKYTSKQIQRMMMSPKLLRRSIRLGELRQERYRRWKKDLPEMA